MVFMVLFRNFARLWFRTATSVRMEPLVVEATPDSPAVLLDKAQGIFELKGRSMPEDPIEFYKPIIAWAADYVSEPNAVTEFVFRFE